MPGRYDSSGAPRYNPTPLGDVILPGNNDSDYTIYVNDPEWGRQKLEEQNRLEAEQKRIDEALLVEKMTAARDLIRSHQYGPARRILVTVDHPTARKWLRRINENAPLVRPPLPKSRARPDLQSVPLVPRMESEKDDAKQLAALVWFFFLIVAAIGWLMSRLA